MRIFAIDPGTTASGWLYCQTDPFKIVEHGITDNAVLLTKLEVMRVDHDIDLMLIEKVESFGMAVGVSIFETVYWSGRFAQVAQPVCVERIGRRDVKLTLCGSVRAKDGNIRQALLDKFGGESAVGTKKAPGPLYGIRSHIWPALALVVTYSEAWRRRGRGDVPSWEESHDALKAGGR